MADPAEQSAFWDERADAWARHADGMEEFAGQFGAPAMDALDPRSGQHVADVGCGPGITTVELGRRVQPGGTATGVDVSVRMIESARARAATAGLENVRYEVSDPGTGPIGSFDGIYSRFGVMFFDDPAAAFTNLARSLRPGGRFAAAVWAELDANPWMFVPTMFAAGPLDASLVLPGPGEPGPFSLADPEETMTLLDACGFCDVDVVRHERAWTFDRDAADDSIARMLSVGAVGEAWASADDDRRRTAIEAVRAACDDYRDEDGWRLPATALVVSASAQH